MPAQKGNKTAAKPREFHKSKRLVATCTESEFKSVISDAKKEGHKSPTAYLRFLIFGEDARENKAEK